MFQIKHNEDKKTSLALQSKAASAVPCPLETIRHSAKALLEMYHYSLFKTFSLTPDIATADVILAMRAPLRTAIPYSWLFLFTMK